MISLRYIFLGEIYGSRINSASIRNYDGNYSSYSSFVWLYFESKDKNKTILEISRNIDDPSKVEDLIGLLDERKKEPIDYRRTGVVTLFVGIGLFLFGVFFLGSLLKGVGALVAAIGIGQIIAGYLYPNTSGEINKAVEDFETN